MLLRNVILLTALAVSGCLFEDESRFARSIFPDLSYEDVLAFKPRSKPSYGCTYIILRLPVGSPKAPPNVQFPDLAYYEDLAQEGFWLPTGGAEEVKPETFLCLSPDQSEKFDGAGIAGFGDEILKTLKGADAWFATYGGVEGRKLLLYAPKAQLAVWVRFGD